MSKIRIYSITVTLALSVGNLCIDSLCIKASRIWLEKVVVKCDEKRCRMQRSHESTSCNYWRHFRSNVTSYVFLLSGVKVCTSFAGVIWFTGESITCNHGDIKSSILMSAVASVIHCCRCHFCLIIRSLSFFSDYSRTVTRTHTLQCKSYSLQRVANLLFHFIRQIWKQLWKVLVPS